MIDLPSDLHTIQSCVLLHRNCISERDLCLDWSGQSTYQDGGDEPCHNAGLGAWGIGSHDGDVLNGLESLGGGGGFGINS